MSVTRYEPCFHRSADEGIKAVRNGSLVLYTGYAALEAERRGRVIALDERHPIGQALRRGLSARDL